MAAASATGEAVSALPAAPRFLSLPIFATFVCGCLTTFQAQLAAVSPRARCRRPRHYPISMRCSYLVVRLAIFVRAHLFA